MKTRQSQAITKTISTLMLLAGFIVNPVQATETEAKLQQLQQALILKPDDAMLLNETGFALYQAGQYAEAAAIFQKSLAILENTLGKNHPYVATSLNNLAVLYRMQGKYEQAEPFYRRSLETRNSD